MGRINNRYKRDMKQTAVEWFWLNLTDDLIGDLAPEKILKIHELKEQSKAMEKNNTDNKVIHFAEWLTNKHTTTLITLYEQFEEQYYNETFKSE